MHSHEIKINLIGEAYKFVMVFLCYITFKLNIAKYKALISTKYRVNHQIHSLLIIEEMQREDITEIDNFGRFCFAYPVSLKEVWIYFS